MMLKHLKRLFSLCDVGENYCNDKPYVNLVQPLFTIQPTIEQSVLMVDKHKTAEELVQEISDYIDNIDFPLTTIDINEQGIIEFRTFGEMFDTINEPLYIALEKHNITEAPEEITGYSENHGAGWDISGFLLPYFKQIVIKALNVRDLRESEDC